MQSGLRRGLEHRRDGLDRRIRILALELLERGNELLKLRDLLLLGEEHTRLDIKQIRRHLHKLARDLEIELFHGVEVLQILIEDVRDLDVADLDLILRQQQQDQAQRTFKIRHLALVMDDALEKISWIARLSRRCR